MHGHDMGHPGCKLALSLSWHGGDAAVAEWHITFSGKLDSGDTKFSSHVPFRVCVCAL